VSLPVPISVPATLAPSSVGEVHALELPIVPQ